MSSTLQAGEIGRLDEEDSLLGPDTFVLYREGELIEVSADNANDNFFNIDEVTNVNSDYTALIIDEIILVDASNAPVTITLYDAVGNKGRILSIIKIDSSTNAVTTKPFGTQTINNELNFVTVTQHLSLSVLSNDADWVKSPFVPSVRESNLDADTIYLKGDANTNFTWRYNISQGIDSGNELQLERKEELTEADIDLTDAKWVAVQDSGLYDPDNQYFASVLTDTRTNKNTPSGITSTQVGQFIGFDGTWWRTTPTLQVVRETKQSTNTLMKFPFQIVELSADRLKPLFVVDRETPDATGFAREQVRFTEDLAVIKWERDWVGEGRVIQIQAEEDFWVKLGLPEPGVNDPIELVRFRHYKISNNVTITRPFAVPDNGPVVISSENFANNDLRCQIGSKTMFEGSDVSSLTIRDILLEDRDSAATLFDVTQAGSNPDALFSLQRMAAVDFNSLGTVKGFVRMNLTSNSFIQYNAGLTLDSNNVAYLIENLWESRVTTGATDLSIQGTLNTLIMNASNFSDDDNAKALFIDPATTVNQADILQSTYLPPPGGSFFAPGSLDQTAVNWRYAFNGNVPDSDIKASASFNGNVTPTVITTVNTPVAVTGTTVAGALERFTHDPAGILTYAGGRPITLRIEGRATIEVTPALEASNISFYIYLNGIQVPSTVTMQNIASVFQTPTSPEFVAVDNIALVPGDTIQMFVENQTDTEDITVTALKLVV